MTVVAIGPQTTRKKQLNYIPEKNRQEQKVSSHKIVSVLDQLTQLELKKLDNLKELKLQES